MWKKKDAERQTHKDTRRQREESKTQGDRDTGRLMGEETEKCASKDSRTQSHRKQMQRNRGSKRLGRKISGVRDTEGENPGGNKDLGAMTRYRESRTGTRRHRKAGQSV